MSLNKSRKELPSRPVLSWTYKLLYVLAMLAVSLAAVHPSCSFAAVSSNADITIYSPESLTSVSSDNASLAGARRTDSMTTLSTTNRKLALIGKSSAGAVEMEITNNGRTPMAPVFHDAYFHAQVMLSLGVNLIELKWRGKDGPWKSKTVSIFRSAKLEGDSGIGDTDSYPPYVFHKGDNEEHCQECHQMNVTKSEKDTGMDRSCMKCHKALADNPYVHGPVGAGICTACHDPESTPNRYKVQEADNVLCYHCHEDRKTVDSSKRLLHGPVGAGMCIVCHDPHSSPFEFQLVKSKTDLCLMCHQDDANRWMGQRSLHPPFRDGNCAGCHDPHSSNFNYNLKKSREDLCTLCHQLPIPGHLHEVGKTPQFNLPDDFPLTADGKTMCLTCHDPHGAPGLHLTRRDGCDNCHNK